MVPLFGRENCRRHGVPPCVGFSSLFFTPSYFLYFFLCARMLFRHAVFVVIVILDRASENVASTKECTRLPACCSRTSTTTPSWPCAWCTLDSTVRPWRLRLRPMPSIPGSRCVCCAPTIVACRTPVCFVRLFSSRVCDQGQRGHYNIL